MKYELTSPNGSDTYMEIRESEIVTSTYSGKSPNRYLTQFWASLTSRYLLRRRNFRIHEINSLCTLEEKKEKEKKNNAGEHFSK
jgi:hypothetical protein